MAQDYNYSYIKFELWNICLKEFNELGCKIELGFGWLRAVAQGYNYSYNKINLEYFSK